MKPTQSEIEFFECIIRNNGYYKQDYEETLGEEDTNKTDNRIREKASAWFAGVLK